jgi:dTDP-4-amino-4,6-dideoxygalactose transaminase
MKSINVPFLDLPTQHAPLKDRLLDVAARSIDKAAFIGGPEVKEFESEFAAYCQTEHCVAVNTGTDALRLALQAMGVGRGDTVVTVPNTFIATAEAVSHVGAQVAFVDVDSATCLMDPNRLEDYCRANPAPKAVIPVHLYGQCADMAAITALSERYGFLILEDAAQAHGASQNGRKAGAFGVAAGFSFYPGKNLGALGEGGAVTTGNPSLAEKVSMLRDHGQSQRYHHALEGSNARLDAMQAGFLRVKLPFLDGWNERRRAISDAYDEAFATSKVLRPVRVLTGNVPSRHLYILHLENRDTLRDFLAQRSIQTGLHYPIPLHLQPCYSSMKLGPGSFPHAEASARELISLPLFPEMTGEQVDWVIASVLDFVS